MHSAYSLLEGALQISSLAKLASAQRMPAVGLTDTNNMFGVLEFSDKLAAAGIQPIAGCALQTDFGDGHGLGPARIGAPDGGAKPAGPLALLCRSEAGYAN
ncbi:MAG: PHP domain-containing protein, partial [Solimonas sp.]